MNGVDSNSAFLSEVLGLDVFMTQVGDNRNVRDPQPQGNDSRIIDYMRTGRATTCQKFRSVFRIGQGDEEYDDNLHLDDFSRERQH